MRQLALAAVILAAAVAASVWFLLRDVSSRDPEAVSGAGLASHGKASGVPPGARILETAANGTVIFPEIAKKAHALNAKGATAADDILLLQDLVEIYRKVNGSGPAGGLNAEIVRSLRGKNARKFAVLPSDLPEINADGELVDRWGTPYFFHPISRRLIEIRSAGPDRKLWTEDDVFPPQG